LTALNSNISICYLKKEDYEGVIEYASKAIKLNEKFKKAYINRAEAYEKTEKEEDALAGNLHIYVFIYMIY
jgi:tetratricopeptide (TPR) repeat protein